MARKCFGVRERQKKYHLFLFQLGDLLLDHGDFTIHAVHVLDQLLFGQPGRQEVQLGVWVNGADGRDGLQLASEAPILQSKGRRESRMRRGRNSVIAVLRKARKFVENSRGFEEVCHSHNGR